jgi:protein tyrosine phosphatase (PTP) superfamily phosphohydrolase (DUF442 family)
MPADALESIVRFVALGDTLATAGQPSETQLAAVAGAGFQVVINLALHDDPRYSLRDEASAVASLGMEYVHIPVAFSAPRCGDLSAFFAAMQRAQGRKVFVHCAANKRVCVFVALYRIAREGWPQDKALAAMREVWEPDATWLAFIDRTLQEEAIWPRSITSF